VTELVITIIGLTILLGFIGNVLFQKTSIPNTIWLVLFGMVLGETGLIDASFILGSASLIGAIAIIGILSDGGLHMDLKKVVSNGWLGILLMLSGLLFSVATAIIVLLAFGLSIQTSTLLAVILAGTSAAVIMPIISPMKEVSERLKTTIFIESISDNFSIVIALVMIAFLSSQQALPALNPEELLKGTLLQLFAGISVGLLFGFFWAPIINKLKKYDFSYTATLSVFILLFAFAELIGSNGAIAIFFAGIMLANAHIIFKSLFPENEFQQLDEDISKTHSLMAFLIRVFFFVFLGLIVGLPDSQYIIIGLIIVLLIVIGRAVYLQIFSALHLVSFTKQEKRLACVMVPRGLSAAVLGMYAFSSNVPGGEAIVQIVLSVILLSIITTNIGLFAFRPKRNPQKEN